MTFHLINGRLYEERDDVFHPVNEMDATPMTDDNPPASLQSYWPADAASRGAVDVGRLGDNGGSTSAAGRGFSSTEQVPLLATQGGIGFGSPRMMRRMQFNRLTAGAPRIGQSLTDQGNGALTDMAGGAMPTVGVSGSDAPVKPLLEDATIASLHAGAAEESKPFVGLTADQLRKIMPNAGKRADLFVDPLNASMEAGGIRSRAQQAAFLGQIAAESGDLQYLSENPNFSPQQMMKLWPKRFPDLKTANSYKGKPEAILNHAYAGINGNGDETSGDGYRYRGGGLMQNTGRSNYRAVGFENDPDALRAPAGAATAASQYWVQHDLNSAAIQPVDRKRYDAITGRINAGRLKADERWDTYQRGLQVLGRR